MVNVIRGRAWVLGDHISTDHIISGKYKYEKMGNLEEMIPHVFEELLPGFHQLVEPGDVIVAGRGFGYGSSREHAARLLKLLGIGAILAKSFHRIFYRNAINVGLPVVIVKELPDKTGQGDIIEVDLARGIARNVTRGYTERFKPIPRMILSIIEAGGVIEYVKKHGKLPWEERVIHHA